jgi:hypothetical protein
MHIEPGMALGQIADQRGQQIGCDGRDDADAQPLPGHARQATPSMDNGAV